MWKLVIALCLFGSNGELLEHTYKTSISDCLKSKRIMERNMSQGVIITCGEVEAQIEEIQGQTFIRSIRKKGNS